MGHNSIQQHSTVMDFFNQYLTVFTVLDCFQQFQQNSKISNLHKCRGVNISPLPSPSLPPPSHCFHPYFSLSEEAHTHAQSVLINHLTSYVHVHTSLPSNTARRFNHLPVYASSFEDPLIIHCIPYSTNPPLPPLSLYVFSSAHPSCFHNLS